ncbi:magnesium-dependent phosphatase-1 [Lipomyces arxii]|uniref:magnesium-dependent phosphatase-1 n=1 Tax=Lipomyces arxii TaxID=56418 RepID=UPI0034D012D3
MTQSEEKFPRVFVFDLDYTLWPCWCDTHITPPVRASKTGDGIIDRYGETMSFYSDVPGIIAELREKNVKLAIASRTHTPDVARSMLSNLRINGRQAIDYFDVLEIYPDTKIVHFKEIYKATKIDYKEMIFFDDESRNKEVERQLGVKFILVRNGLTRQLFDKAIIEWRKR